MGRQTVQQTLLHASGAELVDGDGADVGYTPDSAILVLDITAKGGTNPTLDVTVEEKHEASGVYFVIDTFPQQVAEATIRRTLSAPVGSVLRASWDVGGTDTPTFTFSLSIEGKQAP